MDKSRYLGIKDKLRHWTKIITGVDFDLGDIVWEGFKEVLDFRNDLIHYKAEKKPSVYDRGTVDLAIKSVDSAKLIIERFYNCWRVDVPRWVQEPYREIK